MRKKIAHRGHVCHPGLITLGSHYATRGSLLDLFCKVRWSYLDVLWDHLNGPPNMWVKQRSRCTQVSCKVQGVVIPASPMLGNGHDSPRVLEKGHRSMYRMRWPSILRYRSGLNMLVATRMTGMTGESRPQSHCDSDAASHARNAIMRCDTPGSNKRECWMRGPVLDSRVGPGSHIAVGRRVAVLNACPTHHQPLSAKTTTPPSRTTHLVRTAPCYGAASAPVGR